MKVQFNLRIFVVKTFEPWVYGLYILNYLVAYCYTTVYTALIVPLPQKQITEHMLSFLYLLDLFKKLLHVQHTANLTLLAIASL